MTDRRRINRIRISFADDPRMMGIAERYYVERERASRQRDLDRRNQNGKISSSEKDRYSADGEVGLFWALGVPLSELKINNSGPDITLRHQSYGLHITGTDRQDGKLIVRPKPEGHPQDRFLFYVWEAPGIIQACGYQVREFCTQPRFWKLDAWWIPQNELLYHPLSVDAFEYEWV